MTPKPAAAAKLAAVVLATLVAIAATACSGSSVGPTPPPTLPTLAEMLAEKTLGSASAPVTMIEYSSISCSHCADFQLTTYAQIKTNYIDTGRVKFIYRDFPLDEPAVTAAMVARCSGSTFFTTLDALFRNQASWATSANYVSAIKNVVAPLGFSSAYVDACLATPGLRSGILTISNTGITQYGLRAAPTFIINTQIVEGAQPYSTFVTIINGL